jgi:polyisoprenoid-binding protein YceI
MTRFTLFAAAALALAACNPDAPAADTETPAGGLDTETVAADAGPALAAGVYQIDPVHSEVGFRIEHLGISNVDGTFTDVAGTVTIPQGGTLAEMAVVATIQATSIDTRNGDRDTHLRSADFFDVAQFPTLTFRSTAVEPLGGGRFRLTGDLTMHGVTKPVTLEGEYSGAATDGYGNRKVGFSAEGTISRSEWGLTWNQAIEAGGVVVSDEVELSLDVQAALQAPTAGAGADSTGTAATDTTGA